MPRPGPTPSRPLGLILTLLTLTALAPPDAVAQRRGRNADGPANRRPFAKPGAPRQAERIRTFDVRHVRGDLAVDLAKEEIKGVVTHSVAAIVPGLDALTLDCGAELAVSKVTAGPKGSARDCKFAREGNELVIALDRPYAPDEAFDLAVAYSGSPKLGLHFVKADADDPKRPDCAWTQGEAEETRYWLPCFDYPNEKATSEMVVTVAKPYSVVSNGALVETKENDDGTRTFHWKMDTPHVSYLISLVISDFAVYRDVAAGTLPVEYYVLKGVDEATARRAMGKTPKMIEFFNDKIGTAYPYPKYAQVCAPGFNGGMENISATTMTDSILRDPIGSLERDSDDIVAHELAHQWFGDLLTCRDWSTIWLNEGFASYFDPLFTEFDLGEDAFRIKMAAELRDYIGSDRTVRRAIVEPRFSDPNEMFDSVTYAKGACVLHALRGLIGDDAWWRGIRAYVAAFKEKVVATDDFQKAMEAASGKDLGWFFGQWVYKGGHPELTARWTYEDDDKSVRLTVEQVQAVDDLTPLFRLPTTVQVGDDSGVRSVPIPIAGKTQTFVIPCAARPKIVRIDPQGWIPKELKFEKPTAEWTYQLDRAADALGRLEAARALADRKDDGAAMAALTNAFSREKSSPARVAMVGILARAGEPCRAGLAEAAKDADPRVRLAAVEALANLKAGPDLEPLLRSIWSNPKETHAARRSALQGLAKAKVKDLDAILASALKDGADRYSIASEALRVSLGEGGAKAREAAFLYARPGQPAALRRSAMNQLGKLADDDPEAGKLLLSLLDDPNRGIRASAAFALSEGGVSSALPELERRLAQAKDLSRIGLERAVETLRGKARKPEAPSVGPEVGDLERKAADLELQAKELRNQAEALKLKAERARLDAAKPAI